MLDFDDTPEAHEAYREQFEQFLRQGWRPPLAARRLECGWCGRSVTTQVGLNKHEQYWQTGPLNPMGRPVSYDRDIRVCVDCGMATTFVKDDPYPRPMRGESMDARGKSDDIKLIVLLYDEARYALSQGAASCAVLMFRKLLMHIAVEQGAKSGQKFIEYVEYLKTQGIVGKPMHGLVDRIRTEGNEENHEVVRATDQKASDLLTLVTLLIKSVYFAN